MLSNIKIVQIAILLFLFSLLLPSPFHEESSTLYSLFWIIFTLYLLINWTLTWVLVPSATFPSSLWVAVAKVALFRCLFHINTANKVAVMHLMRWCQPSFKYFQVFFLLLSATFPSSLWVAVAKVALFRRLLHINAANKVVVMHLMWWCQPSFRYFRVFFLLPCPWSTFPSLNLLGRSL